MYITSWSHAVWSQRIDVVEKLGLFQSAPELVMYAVLTLPESTGTPYLCYVCGADTAREYWNSLFVLCMRCWHCQRVLELLICVMYAVLTLPESTWTPYLCYVCGADTAREYLNSLFVLCMRCWHCQRVLELLICVMYAVLTLPESTGTPYLCYVCGADTAREYWNSLLCYSDWHALSPSRSKTLMTNEPDPRRYTTLAQH